jgi:NAD(P)-dependent dehydrogenase (short-subunit alcohol dehydrogenase family)
MASRTEHAETLAGKRAIVTGGSRGIGAAIAVAFAHAGADLAIVGRDRRGLEATRRSVEGAGRQCAVIEADLATVEGGRRPRAGAIRPLGHPGQQRRHRAQRAAAGTHHRKSG